MCGICGVMYKDSTVRPAEDLLNSMCRSIVHRGPDDQGTIIINNVGLGMRRLSIIDLSTGHQPIANERNSVFIVVLSKRILRRTVAWS